MAAASGASHQSPLRVALPLVGVAQRQASLEHAAPGGGAAPGPGRTCVH